MLTYRPILVLFFAILTVASIDHHAAARLRFNRPFFVRAGKMTKRLVDRMIPVYEIPEFHFKPFHYITLNFRRWKITDLDFPRTRFAISDQGVNLHSTGGSLNVGVEYEFHYLLFTEKGRANVSFTDIRTNVLATISTNMSRPNFDIPWCEAKLGKSKIRVHGSHGVFTWFVKVYISDFVRGVLKHNMCLFLTSARDIVNEFVEAQPESIRLYRNIYLNYTADVDPVFTEDYVEASSTFRADLIGKYADPKNKSIDDSESEERSLARKLSFSMKHSSSWVKFTRDVATLNRDAFIRLIAVILMKLVMWILVFYVPFKCFMIMYEDGGEKTQLLPPRTNDIEMNEYQRLN